MPCMCEKSMWLAFVSVACGMHARLEVCRLQLWLAAVHGCKAVLILSACWALALHVWSLPLVSSEASRLPSGTLPPANIPWPLWLGGACSTGVILQQRMHLEGA